jgi:hypothetical protein
MWVKEQNMYLRVGFEFDEQGDLFSRTGSWVDKQVDFVYEIFFREPKFPNRIEFQTWAVDGRK